MTGPQPVHHAPHLPRLVAGGLPQLARLLSLLLSRPALQLGTPLRRLRGPQCLLLLAARQEVKVGGQAAVSCAARANPRRQLGKQGSGMKATLLQASRSGVARPRVPEPLQRA